MLEIKNLTAGYDPENPVLKNIALDFPESSVTGILGSNGAGKTTFFNAVSRLRAPYSGEILLNKIPLDSSNWSFLETSPFFYPYITGSECLQLCTLSNPDFEFEKWNEIFGLPLHQLTETYSTGMKKKLSLLGVIGQNRKVLLLDGPFNGLDLEAVEVVLLVLEKLKNQGKIILLSSHVLSTLTDVCDRIYWLKEGQIFRAFERQDFPELENILKKTIRHQTAGKLDEL